MQQKNLILAIALSVGFLFIWSIFVVPRYTPKPLPTPPPAPTPAAVPTKPAVLAPAHAEVAERYSVLRNEQSEVVIAPQGGAVRAWRLTLKGQEIDLVNNPTGVVESVDAASHNVRIKKDAGGSGTFTVGPGTTIARGNQAVGLDQLRVGDRIVIRMHQGLASFPETDFSVRVQDGQAVMQGVLPNGIRVTKTLRLSSENFLNEVSFRFVNPTAKAIEMRGWEWGWGPGLGTSPNERKENSRMIRVLTLGRQKVHVLKDGGEMPAFGRWAGMDNRYFLVAFVPASPHNTQLAAAGKGDGAVLRLLETTVVPPRSEVTLRYELYAGPKGYTHLKTYGKGLEESVDFGFFSWLGRLILSVVYWLRNWTGNYGWAIILLTLILNVLLLPLTLKSFRATLAMKKLQPQIAALQKQFKSDPKRLNVEMMNLYKKSGTNPFGGCLPVLLQLPIFWALFTTLRNAYELRGAPWIGWIGDLSAADPYYVLPIVMGAGMFVQQRMSGAVTDPTQRQMMIIMPIIFTVMFLNFASGLVLYWLTNSLITMAIQWVFYRYQEEHAR